MPRKQPTPAKPKKPKKPKKSKPSDPELKRQLASADQDHPVEAVFTLRAPDDNPVLGADEVHQKVDRIVKSAQEASGQEACDLHVMPNMQSFSLAAPPRAA